MGWTGSSDTLRQVRLWFPTRAAAVAYAQRQGLHYDVREDVVLSQSAPQVGDADASLLDAHLPTSISVWNAPPRVSSEKKLVANDTAGADGSSPSDLPRPVWALAASYGDQP